MANLIRVKQLDQPDLSGFFNDAFINTGIFDATFVDKFTDQNISGVKTFIDGINLNNVDNLSLSGVDIIITSGNVTVNNLNIAGNSGKINLDEYNSINWGGNVSIYGDGEILNIDCPANLNINGPLYLLSTINGKTGTFERLFANNLVYNTGNQIISGVKTFTSFPTVNNTGIVYQLGNQNISGQKRFVDQDIVSTVTFNSPNQPSTFIGGFSGPGVFRFEVKPEYRPVVFPNPNYFYTGVNVGQPVEIYFNTGTSKWWYTVNNIFVDASPIVQASSSSAPLPLNNWSGGNMRIYPTYSHNISHYTDGNDPIDVDRINGVAKTGAQTISGVKTFILQPILSGNPLITGNLSLYATTTNLASTGSTLLSNISSLSGSSVLIYGNQNISGAKTFFDSGVFSLSEVLPLSLANNPLSIVGSGNSYLQLNIQNRATGNTASADLVITANNGTDSTNFINLGINNVGYNDPNFTNGTGLDGYLFIDGGDLDIGTRTPGRAIEFHAGGASAVNTIARISQSGINLISGTLNLSNSYLSGENIKPNTGIALYNRTANARQILTQVDPGGKSIAFQPSFVSNRVIFYQPRPNSVSFTNTNTNINLSANTFGVVAARPIYLQTNDILGHIPRIGFVHTGGLFEAGFTNSVEPTTFRGTGGLGGFFFQTRFAISENRIGTSGKGFWGLWDKQTIAATISNPGGVINTPYGSDRQNIIGVGFNSGDSNLSFIHADNTAPGTDDATRKKISLGSNFPIRSGNVYEFSMYALPDQTYVDMNISILKSGIFSGYRATNALPAPNYPLAPNFSINGPAATGNIAFDLCAFYLDTPY